jgi:polysaccharide export outer membrane protein
MMTNKWMAQLIAWLLIVVAATASAQPSDAQPMQAPRTMPVQPAMMPAPMSVNDGYRLGADDEVEVTIFGQGPGQSVKTRVKNDGTITLPFLGPIQVSHQTARELAVDIATRLRSGGYFTKPVVNVEVTQFVSNSITVFGEVGTPGLYPLDIHLTVGMLLARAGGTRGTGADFAILKRFGDPVEHRIVLSSLNGDWSATTLLAPKDTLYVPVAPVIYIYGQVNSPGSFPLKTGMTVRQALARAGGPTLAGSTHNITIYRAGQKLKKVNLESELLADDSLFINERLF